MIFLILIRRSGIMLLLYKPVGTSYFPLRNWALHETWLMKVLQISLSVLGGEIGDVPLWCLVLGTRRVLVCDFRRNVRVDASLVGTREGQSLGWCCGGVSGGGPLVILLKNRGGALVLHGVHGMCFLQRLDVLWVMSVDWGCKPGLWLILCCECLLA